MNRLSILWIHYESIVFFVNVLWIYYKTIIVFSNSLWVHYLFREFTVNFLSDSQIHYESINFFANSQWVQFLRIYFELKLFITRIHYNFTLCFPNSLWIHILLREYRSGSLLRSRTTFKVIFSNPRFIIGLFWLWTCRIKKILWYWHRVYFDWPSRIVEK